MSAPFFKHTWTINVGHEKPATISVLATNPNTARRTITDYISSIAGVLKSINTNPHRLKSVENLRIDINRELGISVAASLGIPIDQVPDEFDANICRVSENLDWLLFKVQPTIALADPPKSSADYDPLFRHYIPCN